MKPLIRLLFILLLLPLATARAADAYFGTQNGGRVTVDPDTNRATITREGVAAPLWDGTHRMEDGSILIIRQGVVVPNEPVLEARERPEPEEEGWKVEHIIGYSPCEKLVRRVCGRKDQCADTEGCNLAQQLLDMEEAERDDSSNRSLTTFTSGRCQRVEKDPGLFPDCKQDQR
jgi:hypothetical protein